MNPRLQRLRLWWASARSTVVEATWERRFWVAVCIAGLAISSIRTSIPILFFMSGWALVKGAGIEKVQAQRDMLQEEADETSGS